MSDIWWICSGFVSRGWNFLQISFLLRMGIFELCKCSNEMLTYGPSYAHGDGEHGVEFPSHGCKCVDSWVGLSCFSLMPLLRNRGMTICEFYELYEVDGD